MDFDGCINNLQDLCNSFDGKVIDPEMTINDEICVRISSLHSNIKEMKEQMEKTMENIFNNQQTYKSIFDAGAIKEYEEKYNALQTEKENMSKDLEITQKAIDLKTNELQKLVKDEQQIQCLKEQQKQSFAVDFPAIKHCMYFYEHVMKIDWNGIRDGNENESNENVINNYHIFGHMYLPSHQKIEKFQFEIDARNEEKSRFELVQNMWNIMDQEIQYEIQQLLPKFNLK